MPRAFERRGSSLWTELIQQCIGLCGYTHGDAVFWPPGQGNQVGHRFANTGASFCQQDCETLPKARFTTQGHFALFFARLIFLVQRAQ